MTTTLAFSAAGAELYNYEVSVADDLSRMKVVARFATAVHKIEAISRDAGSVLLDARECETNNVILIRNRRMRLPKSGIHCMTYNVDLAKAAQLDSRNDELAANNVLVSPVLWLWRPVIDADNEIEVSFQLAEDIRVAVPWTPVADRPDVYRIPASPENAPAPVAFGDFSQNVVPVGGAQITVTILQTKAHADSDAIVAWVSTAAGNVTQAYGRFPVPRAHVVIIPWSATSQDDVPRLFGKVIRDGGASIEFRINTNEPIEEYYGHWTATHEFSHLLLPYVYSRHRWISEGFAQYYQNVLLARTGTYSDPVFWLNLRNGFERGLNSSPSLSPNEAAVELDRASTMKIYWSGAALAMMADVELRRRSNGSESLDLVLDRLQQCCLPASRSWYGPELMQKMDSLIDSPVFMPLYQQMADASGFPNVTPILQSLGVEFANDRIILLDSAELAAVRAAITAPRVPGEE